MTDFEKKIGYEFKDKKLLELLNEYHLYPKEETKKQILDNELFRKYKEKETDLNRQTAPIPVILQVQRAMYITFRLKTSMLI